jgi:hypothetical protein
MKPVTGLKVLFVIVTILVAMGSLWCQKPGNTAPKYDPTHEVKVKGTVEDIKIVPGALEGVHVILKSADQAILVHIAPERFLKEMDSEFSKGDELEVIGCKIKAGDGSDELLARQVTKNGNELLLRDKKGTPIWALWDPGKK